MSLYMWDDGSGMSSPLQAKCEKVLNMLGSGEKTTNITTPVNSHHENARSG